jgi:hypothetical protein
VPGSSWSCTTLVALVTSTTFLSKWARVGPSSDRKKTYSVDFFLAAFFTRQARRGTPVADSEAWSADGGVPATAIVTAAAAEGPASTPSGSIPGGRAGRLLGDAVSTQHRGNFATGQNSNSVPGGLDFLGLAFAHLVLALRHRWQSAGQLHALVGGVVPARLPSGSFARLRAHALGGLAAALYRSKASCLGGNGGSRARTSFGFFPRWRVHAFGGLVATLSRSKASLLGRRGCRRKEVIRSGEVRLRRVAAVQLRVSLQKVLQFSTGAVADFFSERSRILTGRGGFRVEYMVGTYGTVFTSSSTR